MSLQCFTSSVPFLNTKQCFSYPSHHLSLFSVSLSSSSYKSLPATSSLSGQGQRCHLAVNSTSWVVLFRHVSSGSALCTQQRCEYTLLQLRKSNGSLVLLLKSTHDSPHHSTSAGCLKSKKHKCHHYDNPLQSFRQYNEGLS